jgi:hypothetical protein
VPSLEPRALEALREYEESHRARRTVLRAIHAQLERQAAD